jgi:hypothetical protein
LFTTHKKAINQTKAHWVTYNPCFYWDFWSNVSMDFYGVWGARY